MKLKKKPSLFAYGNGKYNEVREYSKIKRSKTYQINARYIKGKVSNPCVQAVLTE